MEWSDDTKHTWSVVLVAFLVEAIAEAKVAKRKARRKRSASAAERSVLHSRLFACRKAGIAVNADEHIAMDETGMSI